MLSKIHSFATFARILSTAQFLHFLDLFLLLELFAFTQHTKHKTQERKCHASVVAFHVQQLAQLVVYIYIYTSYIVSYPSSLTRSCAQHNNELTSSHRAAAAAEVATPTTQHFTYYSHTARTCGRVRTLSASGVDTSHERHECEHRATGGGVAGRGAADWHARGGRGRPARRALARRLQVPLLLATLGRRPLLPHRSAHRPGANAALARSRVLVRDARMRTLPWQQQLHAHCRNSRHQQQQHQYTTAATITAAASAKATPAQAEVHLVRRGCRGRERVRAGLSPPLARHKRERVGAGRLQCAARAGGRSRLAAHAHPLLDRAHLGCGHRGAHQSEQRSRGRATPCAARASPCQASARTAIRPHRHKRGQQIAAAAAAVEFGVPRAARLREREGDPLPSDRVGRQ